MTTDLTHYRDAAHAMLAHHLEADTLKARVDASGVATRIGAIHISVRLQRMAPSAGRMQMVFWAEISGVPGFDEPIELDLIGLGEDAHAALADGVHVLLEQVVPVLRFDHDRTPRRPAVDLLQLSSVTDGRPTTWDLIAGPAGIAATETGQVEAAMTDRALAQGTLDSLIPLLGDVRPHWYKVFLARAASGSYSGDMTVDGVQLGLVESFAAANWPADWFVVRQFGLVRPVAGALELPRSA